MRRRQNAPDLAGSCRARVALTSAWAQDLAANPRQKLPKDGPRRPQGAPRTREDGLKRPSTAPAAWCCVRRGPRGLAAQEDGGGGGGGGGG
eukprot:1964031-Pyramimonas_sp.AAC.1